MKNPIKKATTEKVTFHNLPIVGDEGAVQAFLNAKKTLLCNWEGHVWKIGPTPKEVPFDSFRPADKGIPAVYGCWDNGQVTCSITLYNGDESSKNPIEQGKHFYIALANHTETP